MASTLRVRCLHESMALSDGEIISRGETFDLAFADDPQGHARVQRYVELGHVALAQRTPVWWVDRPQTIRMQALGHLPGRTPAGRSIQRGDVFDAPASEGCAPGSLISERDNVIQMVRGGVAILVDDKPAWWPSTVPVGQNFGRPLPTPSRVR